MSEHKCDCTCCGGCHCGDEHAENHGFKEDIIKIVLSSALCAAAVALENIFKPVWWLCLIMYAVPYLIIGSETLITALSNIQKRELFDECFLMSLATLGAFAVGEYPEAVFVMLFFSVGELFEHIASGKARRSIAALSEIRPDTANVIREGKILTVSPEEVEIGEIISVTAGERIPLDGIITDGVTSLNTSALTGESLPREVSVGDSVLSGSINIGGVIKIKVTGAYADSTVARILRLVEDSAENKSKQERFITRFSRIYTPIVVFLALMLAIIPPIFGGDLTVWLYRALMCLVVSCPCAVAVSVPLTYFGGMGCASKHGILIKGSAALEMLSKVKVAVFDKTGTLTKGEFTVTQVAPNGISENELLKTAAAAEAHSTHPIALCLKQSVAEDIPPAENITELAGCGISAVVEGKTVLVGNETLMKNNGIKYSQSNTNLSAIHVSVDGVYAGYITVSDTPKQDSKATVQNLHKLKIKSIILTGDRSYAAQSIAESVGADGWRAELLPQDKVTELEKIIESANGKVLFTGDGINDAPVLARADVGIAMGALGSDAAVEAADIVLTDDRMTRIPEAVKIAKRTGRIARQNIVFSLGFKVLVLILSALGLSNMWLAAFADAGVLVLAVLNATRTLKF